MNNLSINGNITVGRDLNINQTINPLQKNLEEEINKVTQTSDEKEELISAINNLTTLLQSTQVSEETETTEDDNSSFKDKLLDSLKKVANFSADLLGKVVSNVINNIGSKYV